MKFSFLSLNCVRTSNLIPILNAPLVVNTLLRIAFAVNEILVNLIIFTVVNIVLSVIISNVKNIILPTFLFYYLILILIPISTLLFIINSLSLNLSLKLNLSVRIITLPIPILTKIKRKLILRRIISVLSTLFIRTPIILI